MGSSDVCLIKKSIPLFIFTLYPQKGLRTFDGIKKAALELFVFHPCSPGAWELAGGGLQFLVY